MSAPFVAGGCPTLDELISAIKALELKVESLEDEISDQDSTISDLQDRVEELENVANE